MHIWGFLLACFAAHSSLDDHLARWFGLNQSKYQWALDDYYENKGLVRILVLGFLMYIWRHMLKYLPFEHCTYYFFLQSLFSWGTRRVCLSNDIGYPDTLVESFCVSRLLSDTEQNVNLPWYKQLLGIVDVFPCLLFGYQSYKISVALFLFLFFFCSIEVLSWMYSMFLQIYCLSCFLYKLIMHFPLSFWLCISEIQFIKFLNLSLES